MSVHAYQIEHISSQVMAAHERPDISRRYPDVKAYPNVFCDNEIKKDSEIQLTDQQARDLIRNAEVHSAQANYGQHSVVHVSAANSRAKDMHLPAHMRYNQSVMRLPVTDGQSTIEHSPPESSLEPQSVDNRPSSTQSMSAADMYSSLEPINKVIESQSENYKRLSQSDRTHTCLICYKAFRNKPQLSQHELVHNNVRKHTCSYCEKSFKQLSHLNQHIRVHTGESKLCCYYK